MISPRPQFTLHSYENNSIILVKIFFLKYSDCDLIDFFGCTCTVVSENPMATMLSSGENAKPKQFEDAMKFLVSVKVLQSITLTIQIQWLLQLLLLLMIVIVVVMIMMVMMMTSRDDVDDINDDDSNGDDDANSGDDDGDDNDDGYDNNDGDDMNNSRR